MSLRARRLTVFFVPTFLLTHALTSAYRLAGGSWASLDAFLVANVAMLIPGLAAVVVTRWVFRRPLRTTLGLDLRPNRYWLLAWALAPVLMLATLGVSLLVPGTSYAPDLSGAAARLGLGAADMETLRGQLLVLPLPPIGALLVQGLVMGPTVSLIGGLGEELAWRGLVHEETRDLGLWRGSALTALLWAAWHLPVVFQGYGYPQHPRAGALMFVAYLALYAPLMTFLRIKARSVMAPALFHGTGGALVMLTWGLVAGGNDLTVGWGSAPSLVVLAAANVVILFVLRAERRRGRGPSAS